MKEIIEIYKQVVVQIATPSSTGTGFYLSDENLVITNEHVVRDNREVIVDGIKFKKLLAEVLFTDPLHDIALLKPKEEIKNLIPKVSLGQSEKVNEGEKVLAVGHPMGLKFSFTQGIVSNANRIMEPGHIKFVQTDAAINPGNSGGPLINEAGEIIGINTAIFESGNNIGFAMQIDYLNEALTAFNSNKQQISTRCFSCSNLVFEKNIEGKYCPHCGAKIQLPSQVEPYMPVGVSKTIEILLEKAGFQVDISRRGANNWEIKQGSALINISYHEKTGLIIGDAYLCTLPKQNIKPLYEYLLKQNYEIESLTFSVRGQDIVLSLLIFDRYLNVDTGLILFKHLIDKADFYDNILVENYGALWNNQDEQNQPES